MKAFTYIFTLLLGVLLISSSLSYRGSQTSTHIPAANIANEATPTPKPSETTPGPTEQGEPIGEILTVRDISIALNDNIDNVIKNLGLPTRIVDTEYDFEYYIYNNDYRRLLFIAVKEGKVVGYYTDAEEFLFKGIASGAELSIVNQALNKSYSMDEVLTYQGEDYTAKILMDTAETRTVTGIYVLENNLKEVKYTSSASKNIELLVYDLVNSIRVRNGLSPLSWSSSAAKAARNHSMDMAKNNFFDHTTPFGKTPGDRLREEGLNYKLIGENIIAGYGTAILSSHAWYNSPSHRKNLLNPEFTCIGVGFVYMKHSTYKTYITQDFYR